MPYMPTQKLELMLKSMEFESIFWELLLHYDKSQSSQNMTAVCWKELLACPGSGLPWGCLWECLRDVPGGRSVILGQVPQRDMESDCLCPCMGLSATFLHPSAPAAHGAVSCEGLGLSHTTGWTR